MALLSAPYRSPVNFTDELLNSSKMEMDKILNAVKQASVKLQVNGYISSVYDEDIVNNFLNELAIDLNVANGFTVLYDLVKKLHVSIRNNNLEDVSKYYLTLIEINKVLSFDLGIKNLSNEDIELYKKWESYKKEKDFVNADILRKDLIEKGVL